MKKILEPYQDIYFFFPQHRKMYGEGDQTRRDKTRQVNPIFSSLLEDRKHQQDLHSTVCDFRACIHKDLLRIFLQHGVIINLRQKPPILKCPSSLVFLSLTLSILNSFGRVDGRSCMAVQIITQSDIQTQLKSSEKGHISNPAHVFHL